MSRTELHLRPRKEHRERYREMEVLIISAQDLKNVKHITRMRTYAVVYVENDHAVKTHVDEEGGVNPTWNEKLAVKFREGLPESDMMAALNIDIYAHGHVREKPVGSARVLLCDVLKGGEPAEAADNPIQCLALQVRRPSGRPQGLLNIWVPPTGKFLGSWREGLSFSVREDGVDQGEQIKQVQQHVETKKEEVKVETEEKPKQVHGEVEREAPKEEEAVDGAA